MTEFYKDLEQLLTNNKNSENALAMEKYMKNKFPFYGVKTELRRNLLKEITTKHQSILKSEFRTITKELYQSPYREMHQCAIDLYLKMVKKNFIENDIELIYYLITSHSWWDSVDTLAKYAIGGYLKQFPENRNTIIEFYSNSNNMWLNRTAIIFQLDYKQETDFDLLKSECLKHAHSKEFFIQKAIGWALRDYSRFNPIGVLDFVNNNEFKPLSRKEALRNIK